MFYTFDKKTLEYTKVTKPITAYLLFYTIFVAGTGYMTGRDICQDNQVMVESEAIPIVLNEELEFSEDALWELLDDLNVRYPHIVMAQARVETGHYKSKIFMENNNLFGMKCAAQRCTTHKGPMNGHAKYDSWQESVIDYALYQTSYLRKADTEDQYIEALGGSYAEDGNYMKLVSGQTDSVLEKYVILASD